MSINGKEFEHFGAQLVSYTCSLPEIKNTYLVSRWTLAPLLTSAVMGAKTLTVTLHFHGAARAETERSISRFTAEAQPEVVIGLPDGYEYAGVLTGISDPVEHAEWLQEVVYTFAVVRRGALVTLRAAASLTVMPEGNAPADCRIAIRTGTTFASDSLTMSIWDWQVKIAPVSSAQDIVIDGFNKTVAVDGKNAFLQTDLTEFPALQPGKAQLVSLSDANAEITLQYYPIYL